MATTADARFTPAEALLRALQALKPAGRITWKALLCELAAQGYVGRDADVTMASAIASHALLPYRDAEYRLYYEVDDGRMREWHRGLTAWQKPGRNLSSAAAG